MENKEEIRAHLIELERQSKYPWTKEEFMKYMDDGKLLCPPKTKEQIEWWEEWYDKHPEEEKRLHMEMLESHSRLFSEYNLSHLLLRIFIEDNLKFTNDTLTVTYNKDRHEISFYNKYFDRHIFKL